MFVKKHIMLVLVAVLLAAPVLWGAGQNKAEAAPPRQDAEQRTITVTGSGVAYGAPDIVMVSLGVQASNTDVMAAMNETNGKMQAIIDAVKASGVAAEDIRTDNFSIYQDYGYGGPVMDTGTEGEAAPPIYRVSIGVTITVRTPENVGTILSAAVGAGANMVNYIQFDIADRTALQSEARQLAVTDAKARAEELAGLLGLQVGEALSVTENGESYGPYGMGMGGGGAEMAAPAISQGTLSVSMSVSITFALVAG
ncbi:MAG: SIMPL domain-containing protein [Chloroflexi bacterium]|nr:SIMPL domain-containing protein [Chloroflexota bacterium]